MKMLSYSFDKTVIVTGGITTKGAIVHAVQQGLLIIHHTVATMD